MYFVNSKIFSSQEQVLLNIYKDIFFRSNDEKINVYNFSFFHQSYDWLQAA